LEYSTTFVALIPRHHIKPEHPSLNRR